MKLFCPKLILFKPVIASGTTGEFICLLPPFYFLNYLLIFIQILKKAWRWLESNPGPLTNELSLLP